MTCIFVFSFAKFSLKRYFLYVVENSLLFLSSFRSFVFILNFFLFLQNNDHVTFLPFFPFSFSFFFFSFSNTHVIYVIFRLLLLLLATKYGNNFIVIFYQRRFIFFLFLFFLWHDYNTLCERYTDTSAERKDTL